MTLQRLQQQRYFPAGSLFLEAHIAKTDTLLMALAIGQQWALMRSCSMAGRAGANQSHWIWFWGCMAVGVLVKGPVLPVLAVLTLAALCLWHRGLHGCLSCGFGAGFLLLLLCLPWGILVTVATDGEFLASAIKGDFCQKPARMHGLHREFTQFLQAF